MDLTTYLKNDDLEGALNAVRDEFKTKRLTRVRHNLAVAIKEYMQVLGVASDPVDIIERRFAASEESLNKNPEVWTKAEINDFLARFKQAETPTFFIGKDDGDGE